MYSIRVYFLAWLMKFASRHQAWLPITLVILSALLVRLVNLESRPIWLDEGYTLYFSVLPLNTLLTTHLDVHPNTFYILTHFILLIERSEFSLRFLPLLFGLGTVFLFYRVLLPQLGVEASVVASLMLSLNGYHIYYSQEARSYTMVMFLTLAALYGIFRFCRASESQNFADPSKGILVYFVSSIIILYTHSIASIYLFVLNATVVIYLTLSRQYSTKVVAIWLGVNSVIALIYLPWFFVVLSDASSNPAFKWLEQYSISTVVDEILSVNGAAFFWAFQPFVNIIIVIVSLLGAYLGWRRGQVLLSACVVLFALILPLFVWSVGVFKPVFMIRTILPSMIGTCLGIALFYRYFPRRSIACVIVGMFVLILGKSALSLYQIKTTEQHWDWNWPLIAAELSDSNLEAASVLLCPDLLRIPLTYYLESGPNPPETLLGWDRHHEALFRIPLSVPPVPPVSVKEWYSMSAEDTQQFYDGSPHLTAMETLAERQTIITVFAHCRDEEREHLTHAIREIGFQIADTRHRNGIQKLIWESDQGQEPDPFRPPIPATSVTGSHTSATTSGEGSVRVNVHSTD